MNQQEVKDAIARIKMKAGVKDKPAQLPKKLYHGTDRKTLSWSEEERTSYHDSCLRVVNHLKDFYDGNADNLSCRLSESGLDQGSIGQIEAAVRRISAIIKPNSLYEYGDLYLTSDWINAWGFANNSYGGGELGTTAYNLIVGVEAMDAKCWEGGSLIKEDVARIKETAMVAPAPVLLVFCTDELDRDSLRSIGGGELDASAIGSRLFRYIKPVDIRHHPNVITLPAGINPYFRDPDELIDMVNNGKH